MTPTDPLTWLNGVLWPEGEAGFVAEGASGGRGERFWVSPSAANAHTIVPVEPARAARRAVRRYHDGQGVKRRLRSFAAEAAMRAQPIVTRLPGAVGEQVVLVGDANTGVLGGLREVLADPRLTVAITLASPKTNRKPILQLLAQDGRCVGFAKVACDAWTADLVRNEAGWLQKQPMPPLLTPDVVWQGELAGRTVLVQTAVTPPRVPRRRPLAPPEPGLFAAVAALGNRRSAEPAETAWTKTVLDVLPAATDRERSAIESVLEGDGWAPLAVGAWHGDLTPWNLFTDSRGSSLIDWEFAADEAPVGFDFCHFHLQAGNETLGLVTPAALARARSIVDSDLPEFGVPTNDVARVWRLYLVELGRRVLRLRSAGLDTSAVTHGPAAIDALLAEPARAGGSV